MYQILIIISVLGTAYILYKTYIDKDIDYMSFREAMALVELPIITFYQGKTKLNFILDTGANVSVIDKDYLENLNYNDTNRVSNISGVSGGIQSVAMKNISFTYKEKEYNDDFQVIDFTNIRNAVKETSGVVVHGIIGNAFMCKYKYVLNFKDFVAYSK